MIRKFKYLISFYYLSKIIKDKFVLVFLIINPGKERTLKLTNGLRFVVNHHLDAHIIHQVFIANEYDIDLRNPRVIIDLGAYKGITSIYFAKKYPKAMIYSIEPNKISYNTLERNIDDNNIKNASTHFLAITEQDDTYKKLHLSFPGGMSRLYTRGAISKLTKTQKIKTKTLRSFMKESKIDKVDLLKVDCEGAEYTILLNLDKETYRKIGTLSLEYHLGIVKHSDIDLVEKLQKMGYEVTSKINPNDSRVGIIKAVRS